MRGAHIVCGAFAFGLFSACHPPQLWKPKGLPESTLVRDCNASRDLYEPGHITVYAYGLAPCDRCDVAFPLLASLARLPGVTVRLVDIQDCAGRVKEENLGEAYPVFEVIGPDGRTLRHVNPYDYANYWDPIPLTPEEHSNATIRTVLCTLDPCFVGDCGTCRDEDRYGGTHREP